MSEFFQKRRAQSRIKHDILHRYAGAWAGIILSGLAGRVRRGLMPRGTDVHLAFVDGFAGAGRYERDADKESPGPGEEPIWGSPIIALRAIEGVAQRFADDLSVTVTGALVEQDPECYAELLANLGVAGLETAIVPATSFDDQRHGSIVVAPGDFRDHLDSLLRWLGSDPFLLAFIDPFGPSMDLESMRKLLAREKSDAIALFPYDDLKIRGGSSLKPEEDWGPNDRANITRFDAHFGTGEWREIYGLNLPWEEREAEFVRLYTRQLVALDPRNVIKTIGLRYAHGENRTAYYLCMTTRDAHGALKFNNIMRETAAVEGLEIWRDREATIRRADEARGQGGLFDGVGGVAVEPPTPDKYKADPADVERALVERATTRKPIPYKALLDRMAQTIFLESEIQSALRKLRKEGRAEFDGSTFRVRTPVWVKPA